MNIKYELLKIKENMILNFWRLIPNSVLYWAVNQAWAKATVRVYTDKTPDEVTLFMMQKYLSGKLDANKN